MGVEGTASVNINQLSYVYNLIPMAIISGDFELAYSTGESFATKNSQCYVRYLFHSKQC